ncbi:hypothetical protein GCM10027047_07110 [Rhodococcus aerolatus]
MTAAGGGGTGAGTTGWWRTALLRAELRRVATTRTAAVLLLAGTVPACLVAAVVAAATQSAARDELSALGVAVPPLQGLAASVGAQAATAVALLLGAVGATTERRHGTAGVTALTAGGRDPVLLARVLVHAGLGLVLGVVVTGAATAAATGGLLLTGGSATLPPAAALLGWLLTDAVALALWTVLGVGLGLLVGHQVRAVVLGLVAVWVVSPVLTSVGAAAGRSGEAGVLSPTGATSALTRRRPLEELGQALADSVPSVTVPEAGRWWLGGLVLLAWTATVCAAGWWAARRRPVA